MDKREVKKAFDGLTEDVLDNFSDYKPEHKVMVNNQLKSFKNLNEILSIYDNKMKKEEIKKEFDSLRDDLLDNYDNYTEEHKQLVQNELTKYKALNDTLDEYDKKNEKQIQKKKSFWDILCQAFGIKRWVKEKIYY